ncbi:hypothetical protein J3458_000548 [Metarhizium acridum]|uniref:uncharacterized protein n=1 Tax=Metarhizium acridum TaxID=92637 RepID=UPI001C6D1657|nr:hypothetical protein J3458_000548 [Metarhizium acridum]
MQHYLQTISPTCGNLQPGVFCLLMKARRPLVVRNARTGREDNNKDEREKHAAGRSGPERLFQLFGVNNGEESEFIGISSFSFFFSNEHRPTVHNVGWLCVIPKRLVRREQDRVLKARDMTGRVHEKKSATSRRQS